MKQFVATIKVRVNAKDYDQAWSEVDLHRQKMVKGAEPSIVQTVTDGDMVEMCPKYGEQVLPDKDGNCSLCGEHKI